MTLITRIELAAMLPKVLKAHLMEGASIVFIQQDDYETIDDLSPLVTTAIDAQKELGVDPDPDVAWLLKAVEVVSGNDRAVGYVRGFIGPGTEYARWNFFINSQLELLFFDPHTGTVFPRHSKMGPIEAVII